MSIDLYEVRSRKDHRGVDLISEVLPFGRLWYGEPNAVTTAIGYAKFFSRSHDAGFAFTIKRATWSRRTSTRAILKLLRLHREPLTFWTSSATRLN
jgi:hypothetical protein